MTHSTASTRAGGCRTRKATGCTSLCTGLLMAWLLTSCQPTFQLPDPRSCHKSQPMVMAVVGECVIYQAILREAASAVEGEQRPVAVRLSLGTFEHLKAEQPGLVQTRKASYGQMRVIETPHGPLLAVLDRNMPEGCVIVLCAIPARTIFPQGDEDV